MNKKTFDRRDFLKLAGLTTLGTVGACTQLAGPAAPTAMPSPASEPTATSQPTPTPQPTPTLTQEQRRKRVLRIAHLTDFHARPEDPAPDGMRLALRHAQAQEDPPDTILNTGDCVFDSLEQDKGRTEAEWEVYNDIPITGLVPS